MPGEETEFTYYLRPEDTVGFDRIAVESTSPARFVEVKIDGATLTAQANATESGFLVDLPNRIRRDELIELRFASSVFLQSTLFDVFLQDSRQDASVRQRVDPGDANESIESSTNVVSLPVSRSILANVVTNARTITPNGDFINDLLEVNIDLINVLEERPLSLQIYDLAGTLRYENSIDGIAGQQILNWNGLDQYGQRVETGLYLLKINVSGDSGEESLQHVIAVAY